MSDNDVDASFNGLDSRVHQTSYIFEPTKDSVQRGPNKRQKRSCTSAAHDNIQASNILNFPALLNGQESLQCVNLRKQLFLISWKKAELEIENIVSNANRSTLDAISEFINQPRPLGHHYQIPTGLIVTGPNIASQQLLFLQISECLQANPLDIVVTIRSANAGNLKSALKKIIGDATNQSWQDEDDEHDDQPDQYQQKSNDIFKRGRKLLNYDLEILHNFIRERSCRRFIVAFQDSEAFDVSIISQLVQLFSSWLDRIPLVMLFGIATSVELFHERLPRRIIRMLYGEQFDVEPISTTLQMIFKKVIARDDATIWFGHDFVQALLTRQEEHVQSLQTFIMSLNYAYMCHFYANPLSILLGLPESFDETSKILQAEHFEAVRMLKSFQDHVSALVESNDIETARQLLTSDHHLLVAIKRALCQQGYHNDGNEQHDTADQQGGSSYYSRNVVTANLHRLDCLAKIFQVSQKQDLQYTELYFLMHIDAFEKSNIIEDALDALKYMNCAELVSIISATIAVFERGVQQRNRDLKLLEALKTLCSQLVKNYDQSLQSTYMLEKLQPKALRTTVVAKKVQLSVQAISLPQEERSQAERYTERVDKAISIFRQYLIFTNPNDVPFNELFIFNSRSPHRQVLTPRPRQILEQALSMPHTYLDCGCCDGSQDSLASSNPPTAILYKLYLETGGLINGFDLWSAFYTIVGGEDGEDCTERMALMLFYRALAELKLMGMLKQSRRKVDHFAKTSWKGL